MKSVVVTGASTGIGWGCVKVLIAEGFRVFGSVRKQAHADRLSEEFGANFTPLTFDVTDEAAIAAGASRMEAALGGETLFGLVNNAGIAVPGPLLSLKIDDFMRQLAVNLAGPLIVTQAFAPLLGVDRSRKGTPGRIVMISSVGGRNGPPFLGAYAASKWPWLRGFSALAEGRSHPTVDAPSRSACPLGNKRTSLPALREICCIVASPHRAGEQQSSSGRLGRRSPPLWRLSSPPSRALRKATPGFLRASSKTPRKKWVGTECFAGARRLSRLPAHPNRRS